MTKPADDQDFLAEIIEESTALNPNFPQLVAAAEARRAFMVKLKEERKQRQLSQTMVAAKMGTSQSAVAKLESQDDAKESMIDRYAAAIGVRVERQIIDDREPIAA